MSVEEIVGAAGVSRRTFYDNFKSKEDAFLTAYDTISSDLFKSITARTTQAAASPAGVIGCLKEILEFVAAHPHYADACIVGYLLPARLRSSVATG